MMKNWYLSIIEGQVLKAVKNQRGKGGPLEIEFFLLRGVNERGWRGVRSLLKPSSAFFSDKK